jgi:hypothetical protein
MAHDVFICHSSQDRTIANAICSTLEQHRIRCWIAPRDVIPGSDYAQSIVEAIGSTRLTVLVFSDSSNHSGHVRREIERSVSHGVPILPFRVEDVVPSPSLEYFISDAHWLDAMTPPLERHLDHLAETVRLLLDREDRAAPPSEAVVPPSEAVAPLARSRRVLWLALGAAALVVAVVVGLLVLGGDDPQPSSADAGPTATAGTTSDATAASPGAGTTSAPAETDIFVDDFTEALQPGWTWVNEDPARWSLEAEPDWLHISAQASPPIRNLLLRDAAWAGTDYSVSTIVRFAPTSNFQFAGLVVAGANPDGDRLQLGRGFCEDTACVGDGIYFDRVKNGSFVGDNFAFKLPAGVTTVELSLDVTGNEATAWYSIDGGENWEELGTHPLDPGYTRAGLLAHNAPSEITAAFADFAIILP